jgi:hypothetical protein
MLHPDSHLEVLACQADISNYGAEIWNPVIVEQQRDPVELIYLLPSIR